MNEPKPLDETKSKPEIRGGDKPEDYLEADGEFTGHLEKDGCACGPECPDSTEEDDDSG